LTCFKIFENYSNWEDLDTLQRIMFGNGDFENEIREKI
jgi:hypothetical protein